MSLLPVMRQCLPVHRLEEPIGKPQTPTNTRNDGIMVRSFPTNPLLSAGLILSFEDATDSPVRFVCITPPRWGGRNGRPYRRLSEPVYAPGGANPPPSMPLKSLTAGSPPDGLPPKKGRSTPPVWPPTLGGKSADGLLEDRVSITLELSRDSRSPDFPPHVPSASSLS